jgi:hypothetical protein
MSVSANSSESPDERAGRVLTWWHPLLARMLEWVLSEAYEVVGELHVGRMPLRLDVVMLRRISGRLSEEALRELPILASRLNLLTLIEFKSPTDSLQTGDLDHFYGLAHHFRGQQRPIPLRSDLTLIILAPQISAQFREDIARSRLSLQEHDPGVHSLEDAFFETWVIETDRIAGAREPILTLFSRVFLQNARRIIDEWKQTGYGDVLYYVLQQIHQFQRSGEAFSLRYQGSELMSQTLEELKAAVIAELPVKDRLRGLSPEDIVKELSPEDRLRGLSLEEILNTLDDDELRRLADLASQKQPPPKSDA